MARRPNLQYLDGEYFYYTGDCNNVSVQEAIKQNFVNEMQKLENSGPGYAGVCPDQATCNVGAVDVTCGPVSGRRKRREITRHARSTHEIIVMCRIYINTTDTSKTPAATFWENEDILIDIFNLIKQLGQNGTLDAAGLSPDVSSFANGYSEVTCPEGTTIRMSSLTCGR